VELGGWDYFRVWANAPAALMEREIAPHSEWAVAHALALPELAIHDVRVTRIGEDAWHVRAVVKNAGWLPTNITEKALERKAVDPVRVALDLPPGAALATGREVAEAGQLPGRARARTMLAATVDGVCDPTTDRGTVDWFVHGPVGAVVAVTATHARAGTARAEVTLS
jgi:hypothetical protein